MKDKLMKLLSKLKDTRYGIAVLAVLILVLADAALAGTFLWSLVALWVAVGAAHILRRQFLPYFDVSELYERARDGSVGAGLALVAFAVVFGLVVLASMLVLVKVS